MLTYGNVFILISFEGISINGGARNHKGVNNKTKYYSSYRKTDAKMNKA